MIEGHLFAAEKISLSIILQSIWMNESRARIQIHALIAHPAHTRIVFL